MTKVFWLYGYSAAGKTTLAKRLRASLSDRNIPVAMLDGDDFRSGLCSDLGFGQGARTENHRRVAEMAKILAGQGIVTVVATMAPEYQQRDVVAKVLGSQLTWVFIDASLQLCMTRDPKGLYARAKQGKVANLLDYPFQTPRPNERHIVINTAAGGVDQCAGSLLSSVLMELGEFVI